MGFYRDISILKYCESLVLLLIVFLVIPKSGKRISNVVLWILILLSYVPLLSIFALKNEARGLIYAVTAFWVFVCCVTQIRGVRLPSLKDSAIIGYGLFLGFGFFIVAVVYLFYAVSLSFDLSKVYDIRAEFAKTRIPFFSYAMVWMGYVIVPLFFSWFLSKRQLISCATIVALQMLLFFVSGNKSFLFALALVSLLMWVISQQYPLPLLILGLTGVVSMGILSYELLGDIWISSLFTRRSLLDQPQQYYYYFQFFTENQFTYLSQHRIFDLFMTYPYDLDPPHLIGKVFYGNAAANANTGLIGDAYMNFGYPGFVLWGVALSVILKLFDIFSAGKEKLIAISTIAMPSMSLINSALLTNLFTHGLVIAALMLFLLPRSNGIIAASLISLKNDLKTAH